MITRPKHDAANAAFSQLSFLALAHSNVFRLLAYAFYDPSEEFVCQLIDGTYMVELHGYYGDLVSHYHSDARTLEPLKMYQAELSERDPESLLRELKIEYARLFLGPERPVVRPYETFYDDRSFMDGKPLLMVSPAAMAVEQSYLDAGLTLTKEQREPPDLFPVELEFLYYLCKKESDSWMMGDNAAAKKWRRRELAFMDGHLGKWAPRFCETVAEKSNHPFYRSIAHFAGAFIRLAGSSAMGISEKEKAAVTANDPHASS